MSDTNLSFSIDPSGARSGSTQVVRSLEDIKQKARGAAQDFSAFEAAMRQASAVGVRSLQLLGAGFAGMKLASLIKQTFELGARYNELGIGLNRVAANVNASAAQVNALEAALRKTGISAIQSRQSIMSMIQANMDLTQATKLARVAQDAAVVGQLNSSDALQRLVYGLQTAQPEMLRTLGLTVNFEQAYAKMAATLRVGQNDLTNEQKAQARLNGVLEAGTKITGLYEASMTSASKQMRSSTRYVEDLQVKLGGLFQPAYEAAVFSYVGALKLMAHNTDTVVTSLAMLGTAMGASKLSGLLSSLTSSVTTFAKSFGERGRAEMAAYAEASARATFATLKQAEAERVIAVETLKARNAEWMAAKTKLEKAHATRALMAAELQAAEAERVATVARTQANLALQATGTAAARTTLLMRAATGAATAFSGALALIGGWTGVALIAAVGAVSAWATATSEAAKYLDQNTDALGPYMDRLEAARKKVEGLTGAQLKQSEAQRQIELKAAQGKLGQLRGEVGSIHGDGFLSGMKSDFATLAISGDGAVAFEKAKQAFQKTGDIDAYAASLMKIFTSYKTLTPAQKAFYDAALKQADTFKALTQLVADLRKGMPGLATDVSAAGKAFAFTSVQGEAFLDFMSGARDASTKLGLATRYGAKEADVYALAAKGAGKTISDFQKDLSSTNVSIRNHSTLLLNAAREQKANEERYGKLSGAAKVTKEDIAKFSTELAKQAKVMQGTWTEADEFAESLRDLNEQAKKLGSGGVAEIKKMSPVLEAAFGRKQQETLRAYQRSVDGMIRDLLGSATAAEKNAAAALRGRDAVQKLAAEEAAANAIRGRSLDIMDAVVVAGTAFVAERRKQAAQVTQERGTYAKSLREQIDAMTDEAVAYEKGGKAVAQYTLKLKILEAIRNGASVTEAVALAAQWQAAMDRVDKAKQNIDSAKEAMLEATRGVQRSIANLITDAFGGSLKDARDYGRQLIAIFRDIAAQIVATFAFKKLGIDKILEGIGKGEKFNLGNFIGNGGMLSKSSLATKALGGAAVGGLVGYTVGESFSNRGSAALGGAAAGAAVGAMIGGPVGALVGGAAGLAGGLIAHAKKMREEQRRIEETTRQFARSMRDFTEAFIAPVNDFERAVRAINESALSLAQGAAAKGRNVKIGGSETSLNASQLTDMAAWAERQGTIMNLVSPTKRGQEMLTLAADLRRIAESVTQAVTKLMEDQQKLETGYNRELEARRLAAEGRTDEADAVRAQAQAQQELDDARSKGFSETTIKELERVQALERANAALERATKLEKERMDFSAQFWSLYASVTGRTDIAAVGQADATRRQGQDMANDLLKRGVIGEDLFKQFMGILEDEFTQTLANRRQGYTDRTADLTVRWRGALGDTAGAENEAFRLQQEREMREALKDTSAEGKAYVAVLEQVQAAEAAAREEAKKRAEEARKQAVKDATDDLAVRMLVAQGRTEEAEAMAFGLKQQRELREAMKDTTQEGLAFTEALKKVQEAERAATAEAKAKANRATLRSIDQRILAASGLTYDAETAAREIARSNELSEAATEEIKARLRLLHSIEDEARVRAEAKMNQNTFNDLMVESLQLQGRTDEAARMEFSVRQALFRDEMQQKYDLKQITKATFDLAMDVIRLRENAFTRTLAEQASGASAFPSVPSGGFESPTVLGDTVSMRASGSITESSALYLVDYAASQVALLRRLVAAVEGGASMTGTAAVSTGDANRDLGRMADNTALLVSGVVV